MNKDFNIEAEFKKLIENKWLTEQEAKKHFENKNLLNLINLSTSPKKENIFNALKSVPLNSTRVVILGQDPYPNPNHAHGLAFSSKDTTTPDSLKNIFRALDNVYSSNLFERANNDLTNWVEQGVLLLNTSLTFQKIESQENLTKKEKDKLQQNMQKEHLKAWSVFIQDIVKKILTINNHPTVMMLWGNKAHDIVFKNIKDKEFKKLNHKRTPCIIPNSTVMLLQTSHPSPIAVNLGGDFLDIAPRHFIECDNYLKEKKINWIN